MRHFWNTWGLHRITLEYPPTISSIFIFLTDISILCMVYWLLLQWLRISSFPAPPVITTPQFHSLQPPNKVLPHTLVNRHVNMVLIMQIITIVILSSFLRQLLAFLIINNFLLQRSFCLVCRLWIIPLFSARRLSKGFTFPDAQWPNPWTLKDSAERPDSLSLSLHPCRYLVCHGLYSIQSVTRRIPTW